MRTITKNKKKSCLQTQNNTHTHIIVKESKKYFRNLWKVWIEEKYILRLTFEIYRRRIVIKFHKKISSVNFLISF